MGKCDADDGVAVGIVCDQCDIRRIMSAWYVCSGSGRMRMESSEVAIDRSLEVEFGKVWTASN